MTRVIVAIVARKSSIKPPEAYLIFNLLEGG